MPATYAPMLTDGATRMVMMKASSDPNTDGNWANVGGNVNFSPLKKVVSLWSVEDSGDIHIATQEDDGTVRYHVFDPGTDTWTTRLEFVSLSQPFTTTVQACSIGIRSDGDVIIAYAGEVSVQDRILYARREGGTWVVDVAVSVSGVKRGISIVRGASDRMHMLYTDISATDVIHRSLSSTNSLDTEDNFDTVISSIDFGTTRGVSYVSTQTKVRMPYRDGNLKLSVADFDSGANPSISINVDASDTTVAIPNESMIACLAVDDKTVHLLYADLSTSDIFHDENNDDAGWGTDDEEKDAVTCNRISCNVYTRSGTKVLAYLYLDSTTSKYAERTLVTTAIKDIIGIGMIPFAR